MSLNISDGSLETLDWAKDQIKQMLRRSQTKVIFPLITYGLLRAYLADGTTQFRDLDVRRHYEAAVRLMKEYLGHDLHIGGKYYDAYPSRNLPKYGVLQVIGNQQFELRESYKSNASAIIEWLPSAVQAHIVNRLGAVPLLGKREVRSAMSQDAAVFTALIEQQIENNPTNFEIFSFAVIKVHLERFACKLYRDTRTSSHDSGVDISTNFGVVYQIKKLRVYSKSTADSIYGELKANFDSERLQDGNVIIIIDDISKELKQYLINMKVQSISKHDVIALARQFEDMEDREKVLRIIYDEFRREYSSSIT